MDEEWFKKWANENIKVTWNMLGVVHSAANTAWLESARRADIKAREECLDAVQKMLTSPECCDEYDRVVNDGLKEAMSAIRATIKEE